MQAFDRDGLGLETALQRANVGWLEKEALLAELGLATNWASNRPASQRQQIARRAARRLNCTVGVTGVCVLS